MDHEDCNLILSSDGGSDDGVCLDATFNTENGQLLQIISKHHSTSSEFMSPMER